MRPPSIVCVGNSIVRSRTHLLANIGIATTALAAMVFLIPALHARFPHAGTALLWMALLARSAESIYLRRSLRGPLIRHARAGAPRR